MNFIIIYYRNQYYKFENESSKVDKFSKVKYF